MDKVVTTLCVVTQTKSEVAGGAHAVLCARARHAPGGDDVSRDKALKVIPLSQLRQIQREVRLCSQRCKTCGLVLMLCRRRWWRWRTGHDSEPCAAPMCDAG